MSGPLRILWPVLWTTAYGLVTCAVTLLWSNNLGPWLIGFIVLWLVLRNWLARGQWRLAMAVRRFRTISDDHVIIHYAPELEGAWDMPTLLQRCRQHHDKLADRFGSPLRRRAVVFLCASYRDVGQIFGPRYSGIALWYANAIVIGSDSNIDEIVRHELGHLFAFRWNMGAPPLLGEGLSVWLQETDQGLPIDTAVQPALADRSLKLPRLLMRKVFFSEAKRHSCYLLAGSFTGFMILRYGWDRYRKVFCRCDCTRFQAKFKKYMGVSLERAEWEWRTHISLMEIYNQRLGRSIYCWPADA